MGETPRAPSPIDRVRLDPLRPQQLALQVVGEEPRLPEQHVEALAVGDRSLRGIGIFRMARRVDGSLRAPCAPTEPYRSGDRGHYPPPMGAQAAGSGIRSVPVGGRFQTFLRFLALPGEGLDRRDEHNVAPHDRARPALAGDWRLPGDVLGRAPANPAAAGPRSLRGRSCWPAPLRPVVGCRSRRGRRSKRSGRWRAEER